MTQKIIFDCDNTLGLPFKEVDDGLTLLYLLGEPDIELLGITTTFGNGSIDQVHTQTRKLLERLKTLMPLYKGEADAGDHTDTPAARFLAETVDRYPHEITLLATGPLGNLHAASMLNPKFFQKVKGVVTMGGYLEPLKLGYRNLPELNFSANPSASINVLTASCPVTVFPGSTCLQAPYSLKNLVDASFLPFWLKLNLFHWLTVFSLYCGIDRFYLWDLLPAVFLSHPKVFTTTDFPIKSSEEDLKQGILIKGTVNRDPMIHLVTELRDQTLFYELLDSSWQHTIQKFNL